MRKASSCVALWDIDTIVELFHKNPDWQYLWTHKFENLTLELRKATNLDNVTNEHLINESLADVYGTEQSFVYTLPSSVGCAYFPSSKTESQEGKKYTVEQLNGLYVMVNYTMALLSIWLLIDEMVSKAASAFESKYKFKFKITSISLYADNNFLFIGVDDLKTGKTLGLNIYLPIPVDYNCGKLMTTDDLFSDTTRSCIIHVHSNGGGESILSIKLKLPEFINNVDNVFQKIRRYYDDVEKERYI